MLEGIDDKTARVYCLRGESNSDGSKIPQKSEGPYMIDDIHQRWLDESIITQEEYDEAKRALDLFADHIRALATA